VSDVLAQALSRLLLAVAQLPLLARARVRALEVLDKNSAQVGPAIDLVAWQVLEPRTCRVTEVERQVLDDEEVVRRSPPPRDTRVGSPRATCWGWYPCCTWVRWSELGNARETSHPRCSDQRLAV
jgi:hypothetical protein